MRKTYLGQNEWFIFKNGFVTTNLNNCIIYLNSLKILLIRKGDEASYEMIPGKHMTKQAMK